jgi:FtsP/CotA-like multicopper oxidase with cupredoxin domain
MSAISKGDVMNNGDAMKLIIRGLLATAISTFFVALPASAQDSNIYVQCPNDTELHPDADADPATRTDGIKCKHVMAGDGIVTMADDRNYPQYIFSFADVPLPEDAPVSLAEYPGWVMEQGVLAANAPAPTIAVDQDDEFFLTLTNVGMAIRPDLFDPHTIHWHGFPNASSIFDGVPDASISVNMGASLTYYYNVKEPGTYMWHCHVEATEHMQMGMLGSLYVRPAQNKSGYDGIAATVSRLGGNVSSDIEGYVYNDGDGSTAYDVEVPIQIGSFDPDFHDASFNVQPLPFRDMRDRYFLLNGRGYPDTVDPGVISTESRPSQPVSSLINASPGQRILLRISNLNVTQFYTLGTNGLAMEVVGLDARLLRDVDGNNMYYKTNSLTLGGGQSADVIITAPATGTYFLYTKNLDQLANDAENFGGMMTEIRIN